MVVVSPLLPFPGAVTAEFQGLVSAATDQSDQGPPKG